MRSAVAGEVGKQRSAQLTLCEGARDRDLPGRGRPQLSISDTGRHQVGHEARRGVAATARGLFIG